LHFREKASSRENVHHGMEISPKVRGILDSADDFTGIDREDALFLLRLDLHTKETYAVMETANHLSRRNFKGKGENHFHIGLNVEPCPFNCSFCSLTVKAGLFKESLEFPEENILRWAKQGEAQGADALNLMTTGTFSLDRLIEIGRILKEEVSVPLVANTRDINHQEGKGSWMQVLSAPITPSGWEKEQTPLSKERSASEPSEF
jgi:biotin synthase